MDIPISVDSNKLSMVRATEAKLRHGNWKNSVLVTFSYPEAKYIGTALVNVFLTQNTFQGIFLGVSYQYNLEEVDSVLSDIRSQASDIAKVKKNIKIGLFSRAMSKYLLEVGQYIVDRGYPITYIDTADIVYESNGDNVDYYIDPKTLAFDEQTGGFRYKDSGGLVVNRPLILYPDGSICREFELFARHPRKTEEEGSSNPSSNEADGV